ncbi:hypothetical protein BOX15_Mlig015267g1, partial [Macrostomum lignano]
QAGRQLKPSSEKMSAGRLRRSRFQLSRLSGALRRLFSRCGSGCDSGAELSSSRCAAASGDSSSYIRMGRSVDCDLCDLDSVGGSVDGGVGATLAVMCETCCDIFAVSGLTPLSRQQTGCCWYEPVCELCSCLTDRGRGRSAELGSIGIWDL